MSDTDQTAAESTEDSSAPDLDALLKEFDQAKPPTEQKPVTADDLRLVVDDTKERRLKEAVQEQKDGIDSAVKALTESLEDVKLPPRMLKGYLMAMADDDKRIENAFKNRDKDPAAWGSVLKVVAKQLKDEIKTPDEDATDTREAVGAAVRSASAKTQTADPEPDFTGMTDAEFNRHVRKLGG